MSVTETALSFDCDNEQLVAILARAEMAADSAADSVAEIAAEVGVVVVVGGPQTRVGSHRQFVLLARELAAAGFPTLRFDYRGMGDSSGAQRDFEAVTPDIRAAIDALQSACPTVTRVVLWGLCDGAAAALLYCDETQDPRVTGLCLLNPWVRSEASLAKTQVKHYYGPRFLQREFWLKLLSGRLNMAASIGELLRKVGQTSGPAHRGESLAFQERMARGLRTFTGRVLLILSGDDYTAKEFLEYVATAEGWRGVLERPNLTRVDVAGADHTFAAHYWRQAVTDACLDWLRHND
jgi:exosortase A-associated hydrolase 1